MGGKGSGRPSGGRNNIIINNFCIVCDSNFSSSRVATYCSQNCKSIAYYWRKLKGELWLEKYKERLRGK